MTSLTLHHSYFGDACLMMAGNVRDVLHLAGVPVTRANVRALVLSIPSRTTQFAQEGWRVQGCSRAMELAHERHRDMPEFARVRELTDYFLGFASRDPFDRANLIAALLAFLTLKLEEG